MGMGNIRLRLPWWAAGLLAVASAGGAADRADLQALPHFKISGPMTGTVKNYGFDLHHLLQSWEEAFRRFQPGIRFDDQFPSSDAGIAGLVGGVADIGVQAREPTLVEHLMFFETFGYPITALTVASGAYDREGMADGLVIFVNAHNPISRLTLEQLDGIFGAERTGAFDGFKWQRRYARAASADIRTWGQLGLTGEWADQPIHTYGYAPTGMSNYFQLTVLHGSDKWNPNLRQYVESGTKMIGDDDTAMRGGLRHMLNTELAADRLGIAFGVMPQAQGVTAIKPVALAQTAQGPFVAPSVASFQDRSYPLSRSIYFYVKQGRTQALDPKVREFLRFVLSEEGQEVVRQNGSYFPLDASTAREQRQRILGPS